MIVRTYNLFLDSAFANVRVPTTDTRDLTFYLKKAIEPMNPSNRFRVRVNTAEIPFSFSQVNSSNNSFSVFFGTSVGAANNLGTVVVPAGNYDILTLTGVLDKSINALIAASGSSATLVTTFDQSTGKCSFKFTSSGASLFLYFGTTILLNMIGFDQTINGAYITLPGSAAGTTTNSVKNVNVCPTTCIYISSRSFTQARNYEALTNGMDITDVIGKIQLTTLPQTYLMYLNYTGEFVEVNNKSITEINLYLSTNLVDSLAMSDMRWSIHLVIEEIQGEKPDQMLSDFSNDNLNALIQKKQDLVKQLKDYKELLTKSF